MNSQTPIRLMSHRGPLATPSTLSPPSSDRSSPCSTWSASPTDTSASSLYSPPPKSTIHADILDIFQPRSPTLHAFTTRRQPKPLRRFSQHREERQSGLVLPKSCCRRLRVEYEDLVHKTSDLVKNIIVALMFCVMFLRLFGLASCSSEMSRPSSTLRISLSSTTKHLRCQLNLSPCELQEPHAAVLQFLSEQIQHAKALSSLSDSLSLPLQTFRETHHPLIPMIIPRHHISRLPYLVQDLKNLTHLVETPLLDFTSSSFIGKSFSLALNELDDVISRPVPLYDSVTYQELQDAHSHVVYWRTTSHLLLEYSAARRRTESLRQQIQTLHQTLSLLLPGQGDPLEIQKWPKRLPGLITRRPTVATEDSLRACIVALGETMENVRLLSTSLDRITEQLAQTTLENVLTPGRRTDFFSTMASLHDLFAQSRHPPAKKHFELRVSLLRSMFAQRQ